MLLALLKPFSDLIHLLPPETTRTQIPESLRSTMYALSVNCGIKPTFRIGTFLPLVLSDARKHRKNAGMKARITTVSALALTVALGGNLHAEEAPGAALSIGSKPNLGDGTAEANQCFARVSVPAVYRTEPVKTETRAEASRYTITPPVFENSTETVTLSPAYQEIEAVQPEIEERAETIEVFPAQTQWVRGSLDSKLPLTKGELSDIAAAGVNVETVETGVCFVEHFSEATLEDIPTKVLVSEATEVLSVEDAVLKDEVFTITTKPAFTRLVEVPPQFKDGVEKVLVATATKKWQTECGAVQQVDHMTGETLCQVDVPAEYEELATKTIDTPALITEVEKEAETENIKIQVLINEAKELRKAVAEEYATVDRQRIAKPAQFSWLVTGQRPAFGAKPTGRTACFVETPAKIAEYTRKVVKTPGRFVAKTVPAEISTVDVVKMVSKAVSTPYKEPAAFETVERKIIVSEGRIEWQPVLCQVNFSEDIIAQVQQALTREGFEPGPVDGIMGRGTTNAISLYQKANQLADGGLTIQTLEKLGVDL